MEQGIVNNSFLLSTENDTFLWNMLCNPGVEGWPRTILKSGDESMIWNIFQPFKFSSAHEVISMCVESK